MGQVRRLASPHLVVELGIVDLPFRGDRIEAQMGVDEMDASVSLSCQGQGERQGKPAELRAVERDQEK